MEVQFGSRKTEDLALEMLVEYFNYDENDLYRSDRPDIKSHSKRFGIEVVQDAIQKEMKMSSFLAEYKNTPLDLIPEEGLRRFHQLGGKISDDVAGNRQTIFTGQYDNPEHIKTTINKKLEKLNDGSLEVFPENFLYIFVDSIYLEVFDYCIFEVIDFVKAQETHERLIFDKIYLDRQYHVFECDIKSRIINTVKISERKW